MYALTGIYKASNSVQRELFHAEHPWQKHAPDGAIRLKTKVLVVEDEILDPFIGSSSLFANWPPRPIK